MLALSGRTQRQEIAVRIADSIAQTLVAVERDIDWQPVLAHHAETLDLPTRKLTPEDAREALAEAAELGHQYERLRGELDTHPEQKRESRWYQEVTAHRRMMLWNQDVAARFDAQQSGANSSIGAEIQVLRAGGAVFATNPFELFLDFGLQVKARSAATQTFLVQIAGGGTYLPTGRAVAGRGYSAIPASTPVGPEGGRMLARRTVEIINELMAPQVIRR
jgi:hypothetical protein